LADKIYDVAIIGSGPAGYTAAIRAGQYGLKTALIEKDSKLGGTCLHVGCIPTKALLYSASIFDHIKNAAEYGIKDTGTPSVDWPVVMQRKNKIVTKHAKGLEFLMKKNKVTVVPGFGRLTGPAKNGVFSVEVEADGKKSNLQGKTVIVSTGSVARAWSIRVSAVIASMCSRRSEGSMSGASLLIVRTSSRRRSSGSRISLGGAFSRGPRSPSSAQLPWSRGPWSRSRHHDGLSAVPGRLPIDGIGSDVRNATLKNAAGVAVAPAPPGVVAVATGPGTR
jgi:hypothetical protein